MKKYIILFMFLFSCNKNQDIKFDKYGDTVDKVNIKQNGKILTEKVKDTVEIKITPPIDFKNIQVGFLINGCSNMNQKEFLDKGLLSSDEDIEYLGSFLNLEDRNIGLINEIDSSITFKVNDAYTLKNFIYNDLCIIIGDYSKIEENEENENTKRRDDYFTNYRKLIPID